MADCRQVAAGQSPWLTVKQAAARLGVSDDCVYDRVRERRLTSRREGRRVLIAADSLSAYERATTTPALPRIGAAIPTTNRPSASGLSEAEEALWGRKEGGHLTAAGRIGSRQRGRLDQRLTDRALDHGPASPKGEPMQPHHTTTPYLVGPHEPDALSALATADDQLAIVLDTESAAILRLKNRIAAHEAQIEKIQQPGIHQTAEMKRAMGRLTFRLYQLNAALAEVESMRLVGFRAIVSVARGSLNTARQYARVESGLAREFRRRVDGDVGVRALDILTSGVS